MRIKKSRGSREHFTWEVFENFAKNKRSNVRLLRNFPLKFNAMQVGQLIHALFVNQS